jgi:hypothetical protein
VLPENWTSVEMFLRLQTQWRTSASGVIGLDYGVMAWIFSMYMVKDQRLLFEDLQAMEAAALAIINKET